VNSVCWIRVYADGSKTAVANPVKFVNTNFVIFCAHKFGETTSVTLKKMMACCGFWVSGFIFI
jgi:hypothetical protein